MHRKALSLEKPFRLTLSPTCDGQEEIVLRHNGGLDNLNYPDGYRIELIERR